MVVILALPPSRVLAPRHPTSPTPLDWLVASPFDERHHKTSLSAKATSLPKEEEESILLEVQV